MIKTKSIGIELKGSEASSRGRGYYLLEELSRRGYPVTEVFSEDYSDIRIIQNGGPNSNYNCKKLIVDLSDAKLIPPKYNGFIKRLYQKVIVNRAWKRFLSECDAIVVASSLQKESVKKINGNVWQIPDVSFYHERYGEKLLSQKRKTRFVWDGQGHNFPYIEKIIRENTTFFRRPDVEILIVTDIYDNLSDRNNKALLSSYNVNSKFLEWRSDTFIDEVANCDIGLAPVDLRCSHARAKPCNKLVNYGGLGIPSIASRIPSYEEFALDSVDGVRLCSKSLDWSKALEYWIDKRSELPLISKNLHRFVVDNYSAGPLTDKWLEVLERVSIES